MNLIELKASAYDLLAQIQHLQNELQKTNQAIADKLKETQEVDGQS